MILVNVALRFPLAFLAMREEPALTFLRTADFPLRSE